MYTVQKIPNPEIPLFKVRSSSGKVTKTLHRNILLPFTSIPESDLEIPSKRVAKKIRKSIKKGTSCSSSSESTESDSDGSETDTVTCRIIRSTVKPVLSSREAKISSINSNHGISSSLQNSSVPEPTNQLDQQVDNASVVSSDMSRSHENEDSRVESSVQLSNRSSRIFPRRTTRVRKAPNRYGEWIS